MIMIRMRNGDERDKKKKKKLTNKLDLKGSQKHENVKKIISRATITTKR